MRYAYYKGAEIIGTTADPNETSSTPVDENSQEWLDYLASRQPPTEQERMDRQILNDPIFRAVVQEIESRIPGFIAAAKSRLN